MYFNIERARKLMDKFGVDALIASTPENEKYLRTKKERMGHLIDMDK